MPVERRDEIGDLACSFNALMRERAEPEDRQRGSVERLRTIADNLPALIACVDAELLYEFVRRTFALWFGQSAVGHYVGRRMREVVDDAAWAEVVGPMSVRALSSATAPTNAACMTTARHATSKCRWCRSACPARAWLAFTCC